MQANIQSTPTVVRRKAAVALVNHGIGLYTVATIVGYSISSVSRTLKRMNEAGDVLDLPRSGRPALYVEELKLKLIGFYCQTQPLPNSGRWTIRWAAVHLARHPEKINATPSKSSIHRILT